MEDESVEPLAATLENVVEQRSLRWVFVGGKGGVGKTTTSCSLAVQLASARESVLLVSTDPAHNLSDAFGQKFGREPTAVEGVANLSCMEIDPAGALEEAGAGEGGLLGGMLGELGGVLPGIDEAMGFAELMRSVADASFSVVVFDTAPTGHTLRMLQVPRVISAALEKLEGLRRSFGGMFEALSGSLGMEGGVGEMADKMLAMREGVERVIEQFRDPTLTTFVCVCIPEFLSLYETERLVQELARLDIDARNIVVNQILAPDPKGHCKVCAARLKMQQKYLDQIHLLYQEDFHVTAMPLQWEEVRGIRRITAFSKLLLDKDARDEIFQAGGEAKHTHAEKTEGGGGEET